MLAQANEEISVSGRSWDPETRGEGREREHSATPGSGLNPESLHAPARRRPAVASATWEAGAHRLTQPRASGLTQDPSLAPPSNDCHQPLVGAAKVEQRLEMLFCFFLLQQGDWRMKQGSYEARQDSPPPIITVFNELKRKTISDPHTALGQRFF